MAPPSVKGLNHSKLCLRCPDRNQADNCSYTFDPKTFKKCKAETKTSIGPMWRGFISDPNDQPLDFTDDQCKKILNRAVEADETLRGNTAADGDSNAFEAAVSEAKASAGLTFDAEDGNSIKLSQELLEYAYDKLFRTAPAKAAKGPSLTIQAKDQKANKPSVPLEEVPDPSDGNLMTNHFKINIQANKKLFEYQVSGLQDRDFSAPRKKVLLKRLMEASGVLKAKRDKFAYNKEGKIVAYEALTPILDKGHVVDNANVTNWLSPGVSEQIPLEVKFTQAIDLDDFNKYAKGEIKEYQDAEVTTALDLILAHHVAQIEEGQGDQYKVFKIGDNKFFPYDKGQDLKKWGMVAIRGFSSNVKAGDGMPLLNVNTAFSVFYSQQKISEYLAHFAQNHESVKKDSKAWKHLVQVRVQVLYERAKPGDDKAIDSPERRTKTITGFSTVTADKLMFTDNDGKSMSVWDFFQKNHPDQARTSRKDYICVNTGSMTNAKKACWYLPDQLEVVPGQIYRRTLDKLDPRMTGEMITFANHSPPHNQQAITGSGLTTLGIRPGQPMPTMLLNAGLEVVPSMMSVPFRKIAQPAIQYSNTTMYFTDAISSSWRTTNKKFVTTPGGLPRGVAFFRQQGINSIQHACTSFGEAFHLNGLPQKIAFSDLGTLDMLESGVREHKPDVVVAVLEDGRQGVEYARFRSYMDQYFGKASLVLNAAVIDSQKGGAIRGYMASNMMKVNVRLGYENHLVKNGFKELATKHGACDTLVLGADLIHPKQGSVEHMPSIAALVGSVDGRYATFCGSARREVPRQEFIGENNMYDMASQRISAWKAKNSGQVPARILYYRDGTGKTQHEDVKTHEIPQIKRAWEAAGGKKGKLQMTTIIVTKRHSTRFYPETDDHKTATENCLPGTVVDKEITSPNAFDFFLQSHDVEKKGTSGKPTHYFVVENGMGLQKNKLQDLTNNFCYNFAHTTNPVSYATPAYYADKLCERVSLYLRPFFDGDEDMAALNDIDQKEAITTAWNRGCQEGKNPWHPNLNGKMFWM